MAPQILGHTPHQSIKDTIIHSIGLEDLNGKRFQPEEKCPSCMLGKSTLENYPDSIEPAIRPLMRVNMDMYSSSITLIEGHNYAVVFTDSHSEYRWHYGMTTKDETLAVCKRWFAKSPSSGPSIHCLLYCAIIVEKILPEN